MSGSIDAGDVSGAGAAYGATSDSGVTGEVTHVQAGAELGAPYETGVVQAEAVTPATRALLDTRGDLDPHILLERLSQSPLILDQLGKSAQSNSEREWGKLETGEAHFRAQKEWGLQMTEWSGKLQSRDSQTHAQVENIARFITNNPLVSGKTEQQPIDWVAFDAALKSASTVSSVEGFIARLRTMPDIRNNMRGMKELSRIFGEDVKERLFGQETPEQVHERRTEWSHDVVWKAFRDGKIDEAKRDRLLALVDKRAENVDFLTNSIEIDSKFSASERAQIRKMLRHIPPALLKNIGTVYKLDDNDFGAGVHSYGPKGISSIGMKSSALEMSNMFRDSTTETIFFHEIMGHGLRHYVNGLNANLRDELAGLWKTVPEHMIRKDSYAAKYLDDSAEVRPYNNGIREGIPAAVDEFWSDRMSEYWAHRVLGKPIDQVRNHTRGFTAEQQQFIDGVCSKTMAIFEKAQAVKAQQLEIKRQKRNTLLGRVKASLFGEDPELAQAA